VIFDLQLLVNGKAQPLQAIAMDGVPVAKRMPPQTSLLLSPGGRVEFVVTTPNESDRAELITRAWDTGPQGDNDTQRTIAQIVSSWSAAGAAPQTMAHNASFEPSAEKAKPARVHRVLYFSQQAQVSGADPDAFILYYITVLGQPEAAYKMGQPPNIVVHRGDIEDWTVENRGPEDHVFHTHQVHFRVLQVNGKDTNDPTMRDTVDLPYWSGEGPYPSVKLRMDFSDPNIVGTFLYHCHILKHEDMGMMGSIQVLPPGIPTKTTLRTERREVSAGDPVEVLAAIVPQPAGGAVQFAVDGIEVGRPVRLTDGEAKLSTSFVEAGRHTISAFYLGDAVSDESAAQPLDIRVRE
jgi:FtsP/CotA-like multicopper oxidase with cupredoxin domain